MIVLYWNSNIELGQGKTLGFPIGSDEETLDAFGERLAREGGIMVSRLKLERRADGNHYIVDEERVFISIAATNTVRNFNHPVLLEQD